MKTLRNSILELEGLNYTKQDLCFGKYFKAVNRIGTTVLDCTFKLIYQTLETKNGSVSIRNYCLGPLKWSNTHYNKTFFTAERQLLNKSPLDADFLCDVSLWFKLLMNVLGTYVEPIKKEIRELKNLRNAVCHDDLVMDDWELQQRFLRLGELSREILEGAQLLVHGESRSSLSNMIAEVETRLRDLTEVKLETGDLNSYLQDLNEFRQKKTSKMISEGRKELMAKYSKAKILNPCPWLNDDRFSDFTVENTFTTLKLQDSGTVLPMNDILNLSELKKRFVPQLVIVSGVMGVGKTSLYRYLLHEWCSHSSAVTNLSAVDIVIGLEMKWLTSGSLSQFLREQLLKDTSRLFNESDIIPVLQEINVLFIIDGMDEATRLGRAVLREVVTKFTNSTVIVTTRPEFTLEMMMMAEEHVVLHLEGFTSENQEKFVEKVFAVKYPDERRRHETRAFLAYKNNVCASLSSHLSLPLNLALLLVLWCDDYLKVTAVTTTTRLYSKIYEISQQKLTQRLESGGAGHSATVSLKVRRCLLELSRVAWTMMLEESLCLTQEHTVSLMEFCEREAIDPIQALSTFLNSETKETLTGTVCSFSFHHSSSEEFLAALHVSEEVARSGSLFPLLKDVNTPRFQEVIMYITGLLKLKGVLTPSLAKEIKEVLLRCIHTQISDPQVLHRLLQEADGDAALSEIVRTIVSEDDSWVVNSWDPAEVTEAKRYLIQQTHAAPAQVDIYTQYMKKVEDCPQLEEIIKLLGKVTGTKVRVFVERQFHTVREQDEIDNLLVPLLSNNTLLEFVGHAGLSFTCKLIHATNLQSLSVRVTSLEALVHMSHSIRKHRHWKAFVMPSKKWALNYLELFLDIGHNVPPPDVPFLHYRKGLRLKLAGVTDEAARWAGQVVHRMNRRYACVTLQNSHLSAAGFIHFLKGTEGVAIKLLRVMSDKLDLTEEVCGAFVRRGTRIEMGLL